MNSDFSILFRAFPEWTSMLEHSAVRCKGVAFLENPTLDNVDCLWNYRTGTERAGILMPADRFTHAVMIGKATHGFQRYFRNYLACQLKKITYAKNLFVVGEDWFSLKHLSVESVKMLDCSIKIFYKYCTIMLNPNITFWKSYLNQRKRSSCIASSYNSVQYWIQWDMKVFVKSSTVQQSSLDRFAYEYMQK